jgi:hypothetical protein
MTRRLPWLFALAILCCPAASFAQGMNSLTAQEKSQGWQLLFDGKTLNGWHSQAPAPPRAGGAGGAGRGTPAPPAPGQTGTPKPCTGAKGSAASAGAGSHWEVVNGLLTACGEPAGYLNSDQSYKNFILSLEFKCSEDANSGVYVRSPKENGGYEVQIWKQQPAGFNTGGIVNTAKTTKEYRHKADQWNTYQITADGDHLVIVLNGETTLDIHDKQFAEGNIRLQYQMYPMEFRNIKIKTLP